MTLIKKFSDKHPQFEAGLKFQEKEWKIRDKERGFTDNEETYLIYNIYLDEKIIGSSKIKIWGGVFLIQSFIIGKKFRENGYGKALLERLLKDSKLYNCHTVYVSTLSANSESIKMYENQGLKKVSVIENTFFNKDQIILLKRNTE